MCSGYNPSEGGGNMAIWVQSIVPMTPGTPFLSRNLFMFRTNTAI